jgi:hypothetical protein
LFGSEKRREREKGKKRERKEEEEEGENVEDKLPVASEVSFLSFLGAFSSTGGGTYDSVAKEKTRKVRKRQTKRKPKGKKKIEWGRNGKKKGRRRVEEKKKRKRKKLSYAFRE